MKKFLFICVGLMIPITMACAVDYSYEAAVATRSCMMNGTRCTEAKKYINEGIAHYAPLKNNSYDNLKNYCGLLYMRLNFRAWGNNEMFQRDLFNYNRSCQ